MERIVKVCICKNEFQDATYGKGMRLHRVATKKEAVPRERCTVCFKTRSKIRVEQHAKEHQPRHSLLPTSKGPYYV